MFSSESRKATTLILVALDAAAICLAYVFAFVARFVIISDGTLSTPLINQYFILPIAFLPLWIIVIYAEGGYERRYMFTGSEEYRRLFHGGSLAALSTSLVGFLFKIDISRGWMIGSWIFGVLLLLFARYAYRHYLHFVNRRSSRKHKVLIVGSNKEAVKIARTIDNSTHLASRVVGALNGIGPSAPGIEVIGDIADLRGQIEKIQPESVIVVPSALGSQVATVYKELKNLDCNVYVTPSLHDVASSRLSVQLVGDVSLIRVEKVTIDGFKGFLKRAFDLAGALVLSVVLSPLFLIIAAVVKIDSRGRVLFKQRRVGRHGKEFNCYKFRSMVDNAETKVVGLRKLNEAKGHLFKIKRDPRITRAGSFLRRFSLDEFPQLINVIKGEMSLVGPRPPLPREVANYNDFERQRLGARPGMTGYWQIYGRANDVFDFEQVVKMDLFYIENWSITLDIYLLWQTLRVVLAAKGAY